MREAYLDLANEHAKKRRINDVIDVMYTPEAVSAEIGYYTKHFPVGEFDAQDLHVQALLKAHDGFSKWDGEALFSSWYYRIRHHVGLDFVRKHRRLAELSVDDYHFESKIIAPASYEPRMHTDLVEQILQFAHESLTPQQYKVIYLFGVQGLNPSEIADRLHITTASASKKLYAARNKLEKIIKWNGIDLPFKISPIGRKNYRN